jgi:hypothetical protein
MGVVSLIGRHSERRAVTSTPSLFGNLPAHFARHGKLFLLLPGDQRFGRGVPACQVPAVICSAPGSAPASTRSRHARAWRRQFASVLCDGSQPGLFRPSKLHDIVLSPVRDCWWPRRRRTHRQTEHNDRLPDGRAIWMITVSCAMRQLIAIKEPRRRRTAARPVQLSFSGVSRTGRRKLLGRDERRVEAEQSLGQRVGPFGHIGGDPEWFGRGEWLGLLVCAAGAEGLQAPLPPMSVEDVADLIELIAGEPAGHYTQLIGQFRGQLTGYWVDVRGGDDEDFLVCGGTEQHAGDHRPGRF